MDLFEAMEQRHSVRQYLELPIEMEVKSELLRKITKINAETGLHIQLVSDEPKAFDCLMSHYGQFSGVRNYIAMVGPKSPKLEELCGYYGEKLVLLAQQRGLNTCWVAATYKKVPGAFQIDESEKLTVVIALGYGATQGVPHKSKTAEAVSAGQDQPEWFRKGVQYALLAPTAINQQKFKFTCKGNKVEAKAGLAFFSKVDLGIAKYHFELGAGKENFTWAE